MVPSSGTNDPAVLAGVVKPFSLKYAWYGCRHSIDWYGTDNSYRRWIAKLKAQVPMISGKLSKRIR